jgi:hypothetical protein
MDDVPLSETEIAELREMFGRGDPTVGQCVQALRLIDEVERVRALLKKIEWQGRSGPDESGCPVCNEEEPVRSFSFRDNQVGHRSDCELAALLLWRR